MRREEDLRQMPESSQHLWVEEEQKRRVGMSDYSGRNIRTCTALKAAGREIFRKEGLENALERNLWLNGTLRSLLESHHGENSGCTQTRNKPTRTNKKQNIVAIQRCQQTFAN